MNQFRKLLLLAGCMLALTTVNAFPFIHTSGIMADLLMDTVPRTLDDHLRSLDKAEKKLNEELRAKNWETIEKSIEVALEKMNKVEIEKEMANALKAMETAKLQIQEELNTAHFSKEKIAAELEKLEAEIGKVKLEQHKIKEEVLAQRENMEAELRKVRPDIEKALNNAKAEVAKARGELSGYKEMIGRMKADGLLKDPANYRIEFRDNKLIIDGKEQPEAVLKKYRSYFRDKKTILQNKEDRFDIKHRNED